MGKTRTGSLAAGTAALAGLTALSLTAGAGAQTFRIPNCTPAANVEAIIDDSASMGGNDFNRLRVTGMELFIGNQGNQNKTLGAVEFGSKAKTVFKPAPIGANRANMIAVLRAAVTADDGSTNYNDAFGLATGDNPNANARIFLTDGEHNVGNYAEGHRGGAKTYVVGLNIGRAGTSTAADRLQRIASETGGTYYPDVKNDTLQPTFNSISSAVNCLVPPKTFRSKVFTRKGQKSTRTTTINAAARNVDIVLNWATPSNKFGISSLTALGRKGKRLATLSGRGKPKKIGKQKLARGKTFRTLSFRKPKGTKRVRFTVKVATVVIPERTITQLSLRR